MENITKDPRKLKLLMENRLLEFGAQAFLFDEKPFTTKDPRLLAWRAWSAAVLLLGEDRALHLVKYGYRIEEARAEAEEARQAALRELSAADYWLARND